MLEWDEGKRQANLAKHGVDFTALAAMDFGRALVVRDERQAYGEPRFRALGPIGGRVHVAVFTIRMGRMRVISLRKANGREHREWERRSSSR